MEKNCLRGTTKEDDLVKISTKRAGIIFKRTFQRLFPLAGDAPTAKSSFGSRDCRPAGDELNREGVWRTCTPPNTWYVVASDIQYWVAALKLVVSRDLGEGVCVWNFLSLEKN